MSQDKNKTQFGQQAAEQRAAEQKQQAAERQATEQKQAAEQQQAEQQAAQTPQTVEQKRQAAEQKKTYWVLPGVRHGAHDEYGPGDEVELTNAEAEGLIGYKLTDVKPTEPMAAAAPGEPTIEQLRQENESLRRSLIEAQAELTKLKMETGRKGA